MRMIPSPVKKNMPSLSSDSCEQNKNIPTYHPPGMVKFLLDLATDSKQITAVATASLLAPSSSWPELSTAQPQLIVKLLLQV